MQEEPISKWQRTANIWIPIIIALCALVYTFYEGRQARNHNRLSVEPYVLVSFFSNKERAGFTFQSGGLGPAKIKWMSVTVAEQEMNNWQDVRQALGLSGYYEFGYVPPGGIIPPGSVIRLFTTEDKNSIERLNDPGVHDSVSITICYCSLYDECRQTSYRAEDRSDQCDTPPEAPFPSKPDKFD